MPERETCAHETWTVIKSRRVPGFPGLSGDKYGELQKCDRCGRVRQAYIDETGWTEISEWKPEMA